MKNIIASGCSFTENGIGGVPPTNLSPGGFSAKSNSISTWVRHVAKKLNPTSFVNTASGSHGNILISTTIVELISRYFYEPAETLIIFNISNFYRHDFLCRRDHPDASFRTPWSREILNFNFLDINSQTYKKLSDTIDLEQTMLLSKNHIRNLFEFLDNNNFNFYFLWMEDYSNIFNEDKFLKRYLDNLVYLGNHNNMLEFCLSNKLTISDSDEHPNQEAHKIISNYVLQKIK
jgi:hypothetical protein